MTKSTNKPLLAKNKCMLEQNTSQLTKNQKKTLAAVEQKEINVHGIKGASISMSVYHSQNSMLFTHPEIKPQIVTNYNSFTTGSNVEVHEDYVGHIDHLVAAMLS